MTALGDARFRRLLAGNAVSSFGDSALYLSLGIWAKDLTGSNAAAGEVFLALGAAALTAPFGGQLADRLPHRALLVAVNAAAGAVVLSLLLVHSRAQLWLIYAVAFAYGATATVIGAAGAGLVKEILADEDLVAANAARQTLTQGLRIVSPLVGAALYANLGGGSLAVLDAASFAVAIVAVASVGGNPRPLAVERPRSFFVDLFEGIGHLRRTPLLSQMNFATAMAMLVLGFYETVTFAVVAALHRPPSFFGALMSVQAAGSIIGGLAATRLVRRLGEARTLGVALVAWALASGVYTVPALPASVIALSAFGVAVPLCSVALGVANQRHSPARLQGRVFAASNMLITLAQTLSIATGAALISVTGYVPLLLVAGATLSVPALVLLVRPSGAPPGAAAAGHAETRHADMGHASAEGCGDLSRQLLRNLSSHTRTTPLVASSLTATASSSAPRLRRHGRLSMLAQPGSPRTGQTDAAPLALQHPTYIRAGRRIYSWVWRNT